MQFLFPHPSSFPISLFFRTAESSIFFSSSFSLGKKNLNNLSVFWCIFPPSCTVEWREMGWRQTGGKAHESVFFFLFFIFPFFFLNGRNVSSMPRRVRKGSEGWREGGRGVERVNLAQLSAGEGPKRSLQTLVIPLLLMWSQAQQNAGSQTYQSCSQLTVFGPRCLSLACRSASLSWRAKSGPSHLPG